MKKLFWVMGAFFVGVAVYLCLVPEKELPGAFEFNDKLNHVFGHAAMAAYFSGLVPRRSWWKIFVFLLLLGIAIEFAQHYMHWGRRGDYRDVIANAAGAGLGLLLGRAGLSQWPHWFARLTGQKVAS
jgi:VanZ family protein